MSTYLCNSLFYSLSDYENMIDWAKDQDQEEKVSINKMTNELNASWNDFELCSHFECKCEDCILFLSSGIECKEKTSYFYKMEHAKNWREWIEHASKLYEYLGYLYEGEK